MKLKLDENLSALGKSLLSRTHTYYKFAGELQLCNGRAGTCASSGLG
jgi:hypothetical protein